MATEGTGHPPMEDMSQSSPKHSHYMQRNDRLNSFDNWPEVLQQKPDVMADSGFFFTGRKDLVRCFFCGVGIHQWSPEDSPDIEHVRWSPKCPFLLDTKGQDFIDSVLDEEKTKRGALTISSRNLSVSSTTKAISADDVVDNVILIGQLKDPGPSASSTDLERVNKRLEEKLLCKICLNEKVSLLFLPCAHLVVCADCGQNFRRCFICKRNITGTIKTTQDV